MAFDLSTTEVSIREIRLKSVNSFNGDLQTILSKTRDGSIKNCERCFSQNKTCLSMMVMDQISSIRNVTVVYHSPIGCGALIPRWTAFYSVLASEIGKKWNTNYVCTNINESDTVFGASKKLKETVQEAYNRYPSEAIFICTGCVTGIIGEDIDSVADEFSKKLPIPVIPVHCEGIKSKVWATGFDITDHIVLKHIVKAPEQKRNIINYRHFGFGEAVKPFINRVFKRFDVEPLYLYPNSTIEELSHISESLATVSCCGVVSTYLGNALEELYHVPYVKTVSPNGMKDFDTWIRDIAKILHKEEIAEDIIREEREKFLPKIEELKKQFEGKTAVIAAGPGFTYEVARVLGEIGITVLDAISWHHDSKYDDQKLPDTLTQFEKTQPDMKVSIIDLQNHELINIINKEKPDIYICRHEGTRPFVTKLGIPVVQLNDEFQMFGYEGLYNFARSIADLFNNKSLVENLKNHCKLPYTSWWLEQEHNKFYS
ncbi:Nitrogenase molybdenum-iron protein, alpha and beta chain [Treponema sp. JC4]|uniref:nitrogenase component 1 n=1 Tax=Treponema sp. JC4 TaxID=1124982 RepID=UPI00025AFB92|nr:nitrogenase component 1 [Treponema sp. JC4]EID85831.1 Nitrogenase molybdenum-iron protein, alpha and beta chain [Treponema sp. JC4]